jgi:superfamily II RNA helicase
MEYIQIHKDIYTNEPPETYYKYKYELSDFQKISVDCIRNNENLLVTAHTSSGKTTVAIEGITKARLENKNAIYISPLKALSNQKFKEFTELFPNDEIGILTGDIKVKINANIIIVTAEIFRNKLLKKIEYNEWNLDLNSIGCIILDEFHMINNIDRGKVFEEIIINIDKKIQIIMLSATLSDPVKMCEWIGNLKKVKCNLITTYKRCVPLQHGIWWDDKINYFLYGDNNWKNNIWKDTAFKINKYYKTNKFSLNEFFNCIKYLYSNNMTPAIFFLLNRELCYKYAEKISISLVTKEEISNIENIWNSKLYKYKHLYETTNEYNNLFKLVCKGIGYHHSGMIPILKEIVEILYSHELIKVLLVTETFAMGINLSIKTVVFFNITKFDNSKRLLYSHEYTQMAGRSGRRNKDTIGYVIILPSPNFIDEEQAKNMILSPPQKIYSKFSIDIMYILKQLGNNNNIYESCYNSLLYYQEYNEENHNIKLKKFKEIQLLVDNNSIINYKKMKGIDDKIKTFKLSKKQLLLLNNEKEDLTNNINISLIETYIKLKEEVENYELLKNKVKINNQIDIIIDYLKNNGYINENLLLTKNGKILSEINECNPFILSYIYNSNIFSELEFSEIIAICSILINEARIDELIFLNDLECTDLCRNLLININKEIDKFCILENNLNNTLPYPIWLNWDINYNTFNDVKLWAEGSYNIKLTNGNFIKTILRLNNLLKNIENIAILLDNVKLINKLYGFQEKIIRDIVINDSLYIN